MLHSYVTPYVAVHSYVAVTQYFIHMCDIVIQMCDIGIHTCDVVIHMCDTVIHMCDIKMISPCVCTQAVSSWFIHVCVTSFMCV